jgi:peptidoglycan/LPS O-acetylase OafA/YrhL
MGNPGKQYFPHLHALRFLAFIVVFMQHSFMSRYPLLAESDTYQSLFNSLFSRGYLSVCFFFVLSGFLIGYLLLYEVESTGRLNIGKFYMRRVLRIWPLYFLILLLGFGLLPLLDNYYADDTASLWRYLLFMANLDSVYFGLTRNEILQPLWTVSVEEQFYIVLPLAVYFIFPYLRPLLVLFLLMLTAAAYRYVAYPNMFAIGAHSLSVMTDLAIGVAAGFLCLKRHPLLGKIENMGRDTILFIYALGLGMIFWVGFDFYKPGVYISRMVYACFFAFIILEQSFSKNSLFKFSSIPHLTYLGTISYGLYCFHQPCLLLSEYLIQESGWTQTWYVFFTLKTLLALTLIIFISSISYRYYELPFLNLKEKFFSRN